MRTTEMAGMEGAMGMIRRLCLYASLVVALLCLFCACADQTDGATGAGEGDGVVEEEKMETKYELTQRQIKILQEMGLPMVYEELTFGQRVSIEAIETMLSYLEGKYDDSFVYEGYYPSDFGESEHMTARCGLGLVTVYRRYENGTAVLSDDYLALQLLPKYEESLQDWFLKQTGASEMYIEAELSDAEEEDGDRVLGSASASVSVAFDAAALPPEKLKELAESFSAWAAPQLSRHACSVTLLSLKPGVLETLNEENSDNALLGDNLMGHIVCSISTDGTVNIH